MAKRYRLIVLAGSILMAKPALGCEPVVPFMQVMVPALALSGSIVVLTMAVVLKSVLFALFERQLPRLQAAWRMFLGNVLNEFCRTACRCDDRKCTQFLAYRSATGLRSLLATNTEARQGGSVTLVGPKIACGSRWGDDWSDGGELHSV